MSQSVQYLAADGDFLLNVGGSNSGPDGLLLQFTITGTNSLVLYKNTAPPGSAVSLTSIPFLNASLAAQSAGTAITASGLAYITPENASFDLYATLNWTSGSVVVRASTANLGASSGGGGTIPAADVTAGTLGANTGETAAYAAPGAFDVVGALTAGTIASDGAVSGTTGTFTGVLSNTNATANLAQSTTSGTVNVGTGTGSSFVKSNIRSAAGQYAFMVFSSGALERWRIYKDTIAESGANAGSPLLVGACDDAGVFIDNVLTIIRAAGGVFAVGRPITGTSGALFTSPTLGIGYATGAGGAQTQATSKATTVVSNTITTAITMNADSLAAATIVSFTFTNSAIAATDQVVVTHQSGGTNGAYTLNAFPAAGSAVIAVRNNTAGALAEAIVLRVSVYKAVSA